MVRVRIDPGFERWIRDRKQPESLRRKAIETLEKFMENPKRTGLNFEPLTGRPGYFSLRINKGYRILLRKEEDADGELFAVTAAGPHDIYRRR